MVDVYICIYMMYGCCRMTVKELEVNHRLAMDRGYSRLAMDGGGQMDS